jgi:DNA-binding NtrC family response regulator
MSETLSLRDCSRSARPECADKIPAELAGTSAAVMRVTELVRRAAKLDGGVLLVGERGVDVESVARELHARAGRGTPLVVVDCAASDAAGLDQLLFGAPARLANDDLEPVSAEGLVAAARGGTLFLQEITDLPASVQARLARMARDGEMLLDGEPVPLTLRPVASASPAIDSEVREHRFRGDLFRRLSAVRIDLPPLRERREDVPALAERLLDELCAERGIPAWTMTSAASALLGALAWPGNLAELRAVLERVVEERIDGGRIRIEDLVPALDLNRAPAVLAPCGRLRDARLRFERDYIAAVLQHHGWQMAAAAQALGMQRPNLYRKARQLGIPLTRVSG